MTRITTSILLMTALAVSACSNADRFGSANGAGGAGGAYGANGSPSDPTSVAYFNQTIGDRVLFLVDQSTLSPDATVTLDGQANWMNQNTAYSATIEGHADEQGTREYNLALGARRANAVKEYLVSRGVSPNRLQTVTYGKERPIAICSEESCYAKNRRAVTVLAAGAGF
ncbi:MULTISPECIES: peptidoglycan-associated lipoprotein Pal [Rhodovulum]|uniref:Peptidoglycan-associated lipoprotein n=2 Tax=Rhodovulum TaxID=34008 RepID=A0A8E2VLI4_9RHOB|nr:MULTISPECIES: peptidoglycan-associated lipoprotein Pal [Rhodovulum]PTW50191.1 peptidoglycan-associated lipoprotein [Rhodovulum kholense]RAP42498.1 peptidoglycan-associated lipoprotein [Rhodovulum viride]